MEKCYLLIQDDQGKTLSAREGSISDWKEMLGGEPKDYKYTLTELTLSNESGIVNLKIDRWMTYLNNDYKTINGVNSVELRLDDKSRSILKSLLEAKL